MSLIAPTMQAFFTERLITQRDASEQTIASYRDTMRLLIAFASEQTGKQPCQLDFEDLGAPLISAFLDHLQQHRGNSPRTRNQRLAAIHSLFRYAALRHPEHAQTITRVIAIPARRYQHNDIPYLSTEEIKALLEAPSQATWLGRRDHALLLLTIQTGLRVTEVTRLHVGDIRLGVGAHIRCHGKGRKERITPLTPETVTVMRQWLTERQGQPDDPLFPTRQGAPLSRHTIGLLLRKHTARAAGACPSLSAKTVTPHVLRHTNAMLLRGRRVDLATIALWLGHESTKTTRIYEHADPVVKEEAIARTAPLGTPPGKYQPPDALCGRASDFLCRRLMVSVTVSPVGVNA